MLLQKKQNMYLLKKNEMNMLNMKVKSISIKGLTKDLLNGYKIINGTKFLALLELGCGNLMECQEKNIENITK